jgi:curli biogenesis system outer membrane secretion channel CsgG
MRLTLLRLNGEFAALFLAALLISSCATESHKSIAPEKPATASVRYVGVKQQVAIGQFDNRSTYMRGLFSDGVDRLGSQAKTILIAHLHESGRFDVLDRENMAQLAQESKYIGKDQKVAGADYVISGDVVEFGRKETGDAQLYGILGSGKKQVAYSKVTLNVVDVSTSKVVYSVSGAGEYALNNREVLGFGGTAGYDSTLNGKVLDLAIREAVDRLAEGIDNGVLKAVK